MADFIAPVPVSALFTDSVALSGLNSNIPIKAFNIGTEQIRYTVSATQPSASAEMQAQWLNVGESITIPPNTKVWMACVSQSYVNLQYADNWTVESALRVYPALTQPKLQASIITNAESFALLGILYRCVVEIDTLAAGSSQWIRFVAPADKEVTIISRNLASKNSGAEYRLFVGSSGLTLGATKPAYNVNRRINTSPTSLINLVSAVAIPGTDMGPIMYIGAGQSGVGNSQAGTSSRETGFTIYPKNTGFEAKITNLSTATNDIKLTLDFAEIPAAVAIS